MCGPCCSSSHEEEGRGPGTGTDFSLVLNIASVCPAWPVKNTESAREGEEGGQAMCASLSYM